MSVTPARRLPAAPQGRLWFADFAAALGISTRTARRLYLPTGPVPHRTWASRFDFRESAIACTVIGSERCPSKRNTSPTSSAAPSRPSVAVERPVSDGVGHLGSEQPVVRTGEFCGTDQQQACPRAAALRSRRAQVLVRPERGPVPNPQGDRRPLHHRGTVGEGKGRSFVRDTLALTVLGQGASNGDLRVSARDRLSRHSRAFQLITHLLSCAAVALGRSARTSSPTLVTEAFGSPEGSS